jgi:hypothetical protein
VWEKKRSLKWRSQKWEEYHNPCTAWRQRLSPYLKGTVQMVWSHNWELTRNREMGSREIRILNYEFSFCLFAFRRHGYSFVQLQWFCLSGSNGRDVFVRRSWPAVMKVIAFQAKVCRWIENFDCDGYFSVFKDVFWLEKPNFHNRRIYSAAWIVVRNLPGRQYFSIVGADIHLCSYWRDLVCLQN